MPNKRTVIKIWKYIRSVDSQIYAFWFFLFVFKQTFCLSLFVVQKKYTFCLSLCVFQQKCTFCYSLFVFKQKYLFLWKPRRKPFLMKLESTYFVGKYPPYEIVIPTCGVYVTEWYCLFEANNAILLYNSENVAVNMAYYLHCNFFLITLSINCINAPASQCKLQIDMSIMCLPTTYR